MSDHRPGTGDHQTGMGDHGTEPASWFRPGDGVAREGDLEFRGSIPEAFTIVTALVAATAAKAAPATINVLLEARSICFPYEDLGQALARLKRFH
jgi:hypothetical protein